MDLLGGVGQPPQRLSQHLGGHDYSCKDDHDQHEDDSELLRELAGGLFSLHQG